MSRTGFRRRRSPGDSFRPVPSGPLPGRHRPPFRGPPLRRSPPRNSAPFRQSPPRVGDSRPPRRWDRPRPPQPNWSAERERHRQQKVMRGPKLNEGDFLSNHRARRESIPIEPVAFSVFPPSPRHEGEGDMVYENLSDEEDEIARTMYERQRLYHRAKQKRLLDDRRQRKREERRLRKQQRQRSGLGVDEESESDEDEEDEDRLDFSDEEEEPAPGPKPLQALEKAMPTFANLPLLPGEGEGMAQYILQNKRVPRRGELLNETRISQLESLGYVMSGSRHVRMNAAREMKEKLVKEAMGKHVLDLEKFAERQRRETKIQTKLRKLVEDQKLRQQMT